MIKSAGSTKRNLGDSGINVASQSKRNNHKSKRHSVPCTIPAMIVLVVNPGRV